MPDSRMNLWLQRLSVATMLALALALLGVGASLVARSPGPNAGAPASMTSGK
jgi:hypothetical protein